MTSNDITDSKLENGSAGVDEEIHYSKSCCPKMETGNYRSGGIPIGRVRGFFRNCLCGKFDKNKCSAVLQQFYSSGIPLPTDGVDIHRDGEECYYDDPILQFDNNSRRIYIYSCHCSCKKLSRTPHVRR